MGVLQMTALEGRAGTQNDPRNGQAVGNAKIKPEDAQGQQTNTLAGFDCEGFVKY